MRILTGTILAAFAVAAISVAGSPATAMDGKDAIEKRVALMKGNILKPYLVIKKFVSDGAGTAGDVAESARKLSAAAKEITPLFPKGTSRGEFDEKMTRALPKIWEDWKTFEGTAAALGVEAAKLASVAEGGDKDAIAAQFGMIGKNGCGACHKPFRGAKVK